MVFGFLYYWIINFNNEKLLILWVNDIARNVARELKNECSYGFKSKDLLLKT
jgi:hypothetical protein